MDLPVRKQNRMQGYDYSACGAYFITICTDERRELFWDNNISVGADIIRPPITDILSDYGHIAETAINAIPQYYSCVSVEKYCIMPNHIHMIIVISSDDNGRIISAPTISQIVGSMKRWTSKQIGFPLWQKSFHDHVIRNEKDYLLIWEYIDENPIN